MELYSLYTLLSEFLFGFRFCDMYIPQKKPATVVMGWPTEQNGNVKDGPLAVEIKYILKSI